MAGNLYILPGQSVDDACEFHLIKKNWETLPSRISHPNRILVKFVNHFFKPASWSFILGWADALFYQKIEMGSHYLGRNSNAWKKYCENNNILRAQHFWFFLAGGICLVLMPDCIGMMTFQIVRSINSWSKLR